MLLVILIAAQAADALTYAWGMVVINPIEFSAVHQFGPGVALAIKATVMAGLLIGWIKYEWSWWFWRLAVAFAIAVGTFGAVSNAAVILGST